MLQSILQWIYLQAILIVHIDISINDIKYLVFFLFRRETRMVQKHVEETGFEVGAWYHCQWVRDSESSPLSANPGKPIQKIPTFQFSGVRHRRVSGKLIQYFFRNFNFRGLSVHIWMSFPEISPAHARQLKFLKNTGWVFQKPVCVTTRKTEFSENSWTSFPIRVLQ